MRRTCGKCGRAHFNFQRCADLPPARELPPPVVEFRPMEGFKPWGDQAGKPGGWGVPWSELGKDDGPKAA